MDIKESINDTRNGFEESFAAGNYYNRQTQDSEHLKSILEFVRISDGLVFKNGFDSSIRFPKKKDTAYGYKDVLKRHDKAVIDSYELVETDTELYLTEQVNNVLFEKH